MKKLSLIIFKIFSVLRILPFPLFFILDRMQNPVKDNQPVSESAGFFDYFTMWEMLVFWMIVIVVPLNTIISLLLSFKPRVIFRSILREKIFLRSLYFLELALVIFFVQRSFEEIQEKFFPSEPGLIDSAMRFLFHFKQPVYDIYDRLKAINLGLLAACSIVYLLFFWPVYNHWRKYFKMREEGIISKRKTEYSNS